MVPFEPPWIHSRISINELAASPGMVEAECDYFAFTCCSKVLFIQPLLGCCRMFSCIESRIYGNSLKEYHM